MGGEVIKKEEKALTLKSQNRTDFAKKYIEAFGMPERAGRIDTIWNMRKQIRDELMPKPQTSTILLQGKDHALPDGVEVLVGISNKMSELIVLHKEQLELFKKLDNGAKTVKTG